MLRSNYATVLLMAAMLFLFAGPSPEAWAAKPRPGVRPTAIFIDGSLIRSSALIRRGITFVPMRGVLERLGAKVRYVRPGRIVILRGRQTVATLFVGKRRSILHGRKHDAGGAPFRSHGHVYVPLRIVAEATRATVSYHKKPSFVFIYSSAAAARAFGPNAVANATAVSAAAESVDAEPAISPGETAFGSIARILGAFLSVVLLALSGAYFWWRRHVGKQPQIVSKAAPTEFR